MKVQKILLSRIDTNSENWDFFLLEKNSHNIDRLAASLDRVGQIYPLILRKDMDWLFFISGWTRYMAIKKLGVEEAWARIYQKNELTDEEALWMAVEEDCLHPYTPEKCKIVFDKFLKIGYSIEKIAQKVAPAMGIAPSDDEVRKILGS